MLRRGKELNIGTILASNIIRTNTPTELALPTYLNLEQRMENIMLYWTLVFLVVAVVAGFLGFGGVAGTAASIAKVIFAIFLILLVVSLARQLLGGV